MTSYLDFDIEIDEGAVREYRVSVRSPAGEARATMRFPFDNLILENRLLTLQNVLLRSGGKRRLALSQDELAVQEFGKALFDSMLVDDARSLFYECRRLADRKERSRPLQATEPAMVCGWVHPRILHPPQSEPYP